ncbi:MAG: hypothetical protein IKC69_07915, partial [Clostridia bacterium]|nr:hypothetical protein [Clostridia bacterium]
MKALIRSLALILVAATIFSLSACGGKEPATETVAPVETAKPALSPEETKSEEKNTEPVVYKKVEKPLSQADFDAIPIAKSSMSTDELRKICLQYVALSVAFPWVPDVTYSYTVERQVYDVTYQEGELYAGIPYVNVASGNAYRWLEFYDSETGVFKLSKTFAKDNGLWGTACSGTACWGWGRVVNSAKYSWTAAMTQKNGFIPVGSFQYSPEINRYGEDGFPDCKDIAKENGAEIMYESYAKMLPADCLVNNGHVRMNAAVPTVVRDENGKIDPKKSYTLWSDQGMYRNLDYQIRTQSDGTTYSIQG